MVLVLYRDRRSQQAISAPSVDAAYGLIIENDYKCSKAVAGSQPADKTSDGGTKSRGTLINSSQLTKLIVS